MIFAVRLEIGLENPFLIGVDVISQSETEAQAAAERALSQHTLEWELYRRALIGSELDVDALVVAAEELRRHERERHGDAGRWGPENPAPAKPCSRCGGNIVCDSYGSEEGDLFRVGFGYGSRFDLQTWYVTLCDDCCAAFVEFVNAEGGPGIHSHEHYHELWLAGPAGI